MHKTWLGQLSHPTGDKGTPIQRKMGHLWPKHKGHWGHQKLCGECSCSKQTTSPLWRTAKEAEPFTPASPSSPCLPSVLTAHRD